MTASRVNDPERPSYRWYKRADVWLVREAGKPRISWNPTGKFWLKAFRTSFPLGSLGRSTSAVNCISRQISADASDCATLRLMTLEKFIDVALLGMTMGRRHCLPLAAAVGRHCGVSAMVTMGLSALPLSHKVASKTESQRQ